MRIILSPAKKMSRKEPITSGRQILTEQQDPKWLETCILNGEAAGLPVFLEETEKILHWLKQLSYDEAKALWKCNDAITTLNMERLAEMDLEKGLTPAVLAYEGIAYQYMAPAVFSGEDFHYVQEHLRILSGFYGVLKPLDGVVPYRLEMGAKAKIDGTKDLYHFWGGRLYEEVIDTDRIIINLASKEYAQSIEKYLHPEDRFITCIFGELANGRVVQKGTYAKMARGEMIHFMAENQIEDPEAIKKFDRLDYGYHPELSDEKNFVFCRGSVNH